MKCQFFEQQLCTSCQWLAKPYPQQLLEKQQQLASLMKPFNIRQWLPAVESAQFGYRNKAKMVVSGSVERPVLGIINQHNQAVDLSDCPLYPPTIRQLFPILKTLIGKAGLVPYNIERKRGELKYILITQSQFNHQIMIRFVLRSEKKISSLTQHLPWLLEQEGQISVVSANIQPVHMAILEGEQEVILTEQQTLMEKFNRIPLFIRPGSFFQTNPQVAERLYQTAKMWSDELNVLSIWDLFCGVGGFGLHCVNKQRTLTGIEINRQAIESAKQSVTQLGLSNVYFASLDSATFALSHDNIPDLILVNPPRRGVGEVLCNYLSNVQAKYIIYSSCNALTLAQDLQHLSSYFIDRIQLFDMFPNTSHYEVMVLLVANNIHDSML